MAWSRARGEARLKICHILEEALESAWHGATLRVRPSGLGLGLGLGLELEELFMFDSKSENQDRAVEAVEAVSEAS